LCALVHGSEHVILLGDHYQLPPTVVSEDANKGSLFNNTYYVIGTIIHSLLQTGGLGKSLFARLIEMGVESAMLEIQYRMHPIISEFPSNHFYHSKIHDGVVASERYQIEQFYFGSTTLGCISLSHTADRPTPLGFDWPVSASPIAYIDVSEGREHRSTDGYSKYNREEAEEVFRIVKGFKDAGDVPVSSIGIITPYNGQVALLRDLFNGPLGTSLASLFFKVVCIC
jgi:regulator of nonsense transcripts 1